MIKYRLGGLLNRSIPVEYRLPVQRRNFEEACLNLWRDKGFRVPKVAPVPPEFYDQEPCLGLEYIQGERLDAYLKNSGRSDAQRSVILKTIFTDMSKRHRVAIHENEHRLIHFDINIGNVIIQEDHPIHIDFEMGHLREPINRSAAREVLLMGLEVANLLGRSYVSDISELLLVHYDIPHILQRILGDVLKTRFQALHRRNDRKRKVRNPDLVTKYDLAMVLEHSLNNKKKGIS